MFLISGLFPSWFSGIGLRQVSIRCFKSEAYGMLLVWLPDRRLAAYWILCLDTDSAGEFVGKLVSELSWLTVLHFPWGRLTVGVPFAA